MVKKKEIKKRSESAQKFKMHSASGKEFLEFLINNKRNFYTEKTSTGFLTIIYKDKAFYIRDRAMHRGALNKIVRFQNQVAKSDLYDWLSALTIKELEEETEMIEKTLINKGFFINPSQIKMIEGAIKIDLNSAYWQTCRFVRAIKRPLFLDVTRNCTKPFRLRLTGTLGKKTTVTPYELGKKGKPWVKQEKKRRIIFRNIYMRIRKFVDELMVWCWMRNPENFIGFYVDCLWLWEPDSVIAEVIKSIFNYKMDCVTLVPKNNLHSKFIMEETNLSKTEQSEEEEGITPYDVQFRYNEFVNYKFFHNFTRDLDFKKLNFKTTWISRITEQEKIIIDGK